MTRVQFSVACIAMYYSELDVEDNLTKEQILKEIHEKLDSVPVEDLTWLNDLSPEEAVTIEDIKSIEKITEEN